MTVAANRRRGQSVPGTASDRRGLSGQDGFTLIELLVTIAIFLMVVPAILSSVMMTQKSTNRANQETLVRQKFRVQLERIIQEVRESRAVFDPSRVSVSANFTIPDEISGLVLPNGLSDATSAPFVLLPPRGSALALMKFDRIVPVGGVQADAFKLIVYYLKKPRPGDADYDAANADGLALRRFESTKSYMDMAMLTAAQRTAAQGQGYRDWRPPGDSEKAAVPETPVAGTTSLMTNAIAPPGVWIRGKKVPAPGGFAVSRDGNLITVYMMGFAAGRPYILQSQTAARNFLN
jgi:prepilin-type N-terminal cleavage/methylation domain-containing protein